MTTKSQSSFDRKFIPLTTRFDHAMLFASQVHREQDRKKSGIPYLSHLLGVASIVLDYGGDEEMGAADPVTGKRGEQAPRINLEAGSLVFSYDHQIRVEEH